MHVDVQIGEAQEFNRSYLPQPKYVWLGFLSVFVGIGAVIILSRK